MSIELNNEIFEVVNRAIHNILKTHHAEIDAEVDAALERWGEVTPDEDLAGDVIDTVCEVLFAGTAPEKLLGDYATPLLPVVERWAMSVRVALAATMTPRKDNRLENLLIAAENFILYGGNISAQANVLTAIKLALMDVRGQTLETLTEV